MKIIPRTEVKPGSVPVAAYPISVCKFTQFELMELDQVIKRGLGKNNMVGWKEKMGQKDSRLLWGVLCLCQTRSLKKRNDNSGKTSNSVKCKMILKMQTKGNTV